jgi:hypothetical protein
LTSIAWLEACQRATDKEMDWTLLLSGQHVYSSDRVNCVRLVTADFYSRSVHIHCSLNQSSPSNLPTLYIISYWKCLSAYRYINQSPFGRRCPVIRGTLRLKRDGTRAETRFRLSAKRSLFKSAGVSVQSTTGSRGVRISGSKAGYTMFRGSVKSTGYPLHSPAFPSLPLPCVTVCHHISTGLYQLAHRRMWLGPYQAFGQSTGPTRVTA